MKALQYVGYFKLPNDFNGNLADALRLLADYHESEAATHRRVIGDPKKELATLYSEFVDVLHQDGRHACAYNICEFKDNKWKPINKD